MFEVFYITFIFNTINKSTVFSVMVYLFSSTNNMKRQTFLVLNNIRYLQLIGLCKLKQLLHLQREKYVKYVCVWVEQSWSKTIAKKQQKSKEKKPFKII